MTRYISSVSTGRFRSLVANIEVLVDSNRHMTKIALADRQEPTVLYRLDTTSGRLEKSDEAHDVIIVDSRAGRRLTSEHASVLKRLLTTDGLIVVRQPGSWANRLGRLLRRRKDDTESLGFLRGMPRAEAALSQVSLYVTSLTVRSNNGRKEQWVIGSTIPLGDTRFRDQIGRVATNYLRVTVPLLVGSSLAGT